MAFIDSPFGVEVVEVDKVVWVSTVSTASAEEVEILSNELVVVCGEKLLGTVEDTGSAKEKKTAYSTINPHVIKPVQKKFMHGKVHSLLPVSTAQTIMHECVQCHLL